MGIAVSSLASSLRSAVVVGCEVALSCLRSAAPLFFVFVLYETRYAIEKRIRSSA